MPDYTQIASHSLDAYDAYEQVYTRQNPPPAPLDFERYNPAPVKVKKGWRSDWFMRLLLWAGLIGGVIVSASHTIIIFSEGKGREVGGAALLMVESLIVVLGFYITRETFRTLKDAENEDERKKANKHVLWYMGRGIAVAVTVAAAGNVQDVLTMAGIAAPGHFLWDVFTLGSSLIKALAAPTLTVVAGHVLALLNLMDSSDDHKADRDFARLVNQWQSDRLAAYAEHLKAMQDWRDGLNESWQRRQKAWGAKVQVESPVTVSVPVPAALPVPAAVPSPVPVLTNGTGHGTIKKVSNGQTGQRIREYFGLFPDAVNDPSRDVAERINLYFKLPDDEQVTKSPVNKIQIELRNQAKGS